MIYTTVEIGGKEYRCRLTARAMVDLEKRLSGSPINTFMAIANSGEFPELDTLIKIFHASLQAFHHDMTLEKTYDLYDAMVDDGKTMVDLLNIIVEIFQNSGLIPKDLVNEDPERKN